MYLKKALPYGVAVFVMAVGLFFSVSSLSEGALLDPEPPGNYFLIVLSIIFIGAGIYFIYLLIHGKLDESGKSISEVRQESIGKLKDTALLAKIALEDQNSEIRRTAEERLKDLNN